MSAGILCRWLVSEERWDDALIAYQDYSMQHDDRLVWVLVEMANVAHHLEDDEQALMYINQAIEKQNMDTQVPLLCQKDILEMYRFKRNLLVTMQPHNEFHTETQHRYQEAIRVTQKILDLPFVNHKVDEYHMLAQLYLLMEDYATARMYLRDPDVIEKFGNTMEYIAKRELIRVRLHDDLDNTLHEYTSALQTDPSNVTLLMKRFFLCVYHIPFQDHIDQDYNSLLRCGYNMKDIMSRVGSI